MQVFIIDTPIETVKILDPRRRNKQILEVKQIIKAILGETTAWKNHPCTIQYRNHLDWLNNYLRCFEYFSKGNYTLALSASILATESTPSFHTPEYLTQMKRRLFTKDPIYYNYWSELGTSDVNWYWVDNEWRYYRSGKRIKI